MLNYLRALLVVANPIERKKLGADLKTGIKLVTIKDNIESFQKLLGGPVEAVHISSDTLLLVNEEGELKRLDPNFYIYHKGLKFDRSQVILGNVIFIGQKDSSFIGLTNKQMDIIKHELITARGIRF